MEKSSQRSTLCAVLPVMSIVVPLVEIFASPAFVSACAPSIGSAYACGAANGAAILPAKSAQRSVRRRCAFDEAFILRLPFSIRTDHIPLVLSVFLYYSIFMDVSHKIAESDDNIHESDVFHRVAESKYIGIADKIDPQIGVDFSVRLRRQTGRIAKAMWRICRH